MAGTSMAAALTSACAAVLMEAEPDLPARWIARFLRASSTRVTNPRNGLSFPRLDCADSVAAAAAGFPVMGGKLRVRDRRGRPRFRKLLVESTDPVIEVPRAGSGGDPRIEGAVLSLRNPSTGESQAFALPGSGWKPIGWNALARRGWRYLDPQYENGPCSLLVVKPGRLRAECRAAKQPISFTLDEPVQKELTVSVQFGVERPYCMSFGGVLQDYGVGMRHGPARRGVGRFWGRRADPPRSCEVL